MTSIKRVVINASPLITLCRSQLHVLLPQLFEAVYVPDAVWQEVVNGGKDDAAARRCARSINIAMTGTCGVIVLAKRRGLLPKAEPAFRQLQAAGLWLSEELIAALLQEACEISG